MGLHRTRRRAGWRAVAFTHAGLAVQRSRAPHCRSTHARRRGGRRRSELMPPDQLLRQAFETCEDFAAARRMLETTPVARPVIFTLIGCGVNERCVIERTETGFATREDDTCAANDWVPPRPGWEGRIGTRRFLVCSFDDATGYSGARREALANWHGSLPDDPFDWGREPVLNP